MNLKKIKIFIVMVIMGSLVSIAGFKDAKMFLSGKTIDLNTATMDDFKKECMIEGDITYVDGQFATYEEKQKKYGVTTSTNQTYYYLVENISMDYLKKLAYGEETEEPDNYYAYVVAVSSEYMKNRLDENSQGWMDFFDGKTDVMPVPVHIEGKLWQQPSGSDYIKIRDESLEEIGFDLSELAEMKVMDSKPGVISLVLFVGGIVVALIGLAILVVPIIMSKRQKEEELYY